MEIIKVAGASKPNLLAGAIVAAIKENPGNTAQMQAIGAGAVNQSIKAVAIARGFLAPMGQDLICSPSFFDTTIGNEERTAIKLSLQLIER